MGRSAALRIVGLAFCISAMVGRGWYRSGDGLTIRDNDVGDVGGRSEGQKNVTIREIRGLGLSKFTCRRRIFGPFPSNQLLQLVYGVPRGSQP